MASSRAKGAPKKASSLYVDRGRVHRHIVPLLGNKRVQSLRPADINKFIEDVATGKSATIEKTSNKRGKSIVRGGLGTAVRPVGLLGGILTYAGGQGVIERNPAHGIRKPADRVRKWRLSDDEYRLLGPILQEKAMDEQFETTVQIIRYLAFTACRRGEAIYLKGSEVDVDASCLRLVDSNEGASVRPRPHMETGPHIHFRGPDGSSGSGKKSESRSRLLVGAVRG